MPPLLLPFQLVLLMFAGWLNRHLIMDRDTKYSDALCGIVTRAGTDVVRLPPRSPNWNPFAERFVRSIKSECLNRMIFFGRAPLQHAVSQFMAHYHTERNHQGIENRLVQPALTIAPCLPVRRHQRLGGMLNFYHRQAA